MSYRLILPLFVTIEPGDLIYVNMLVSRLESDLFGSCNALLVPFITSFHILITFSYGSPSCMLYIYISLFTIPIDFDNYTPRSGRGVRFKTFILCYPFHCYYGL